MSDRELHSFSWSGQELTEQRDMGKRKKKVRLDIGVGRFRILGGPRLRILGGPGGAKFPAGT